VPSRIQWEIVVRAEIRLEPWGDGDLPLLKRLLGDSAMMTHLGGPEPAAKIAERQQRYLADPRQTRIVIAATGEAVGWVGYWDRMWQEQPVFETGWSVLPEWQGQGIASRATALALAAARADGDRRYVHAFPSVDNGPSNRVCIKLGFELMGEVSFEYPPGSGDVLPCNDWRFDLR
jgi:RimJ/RimL family protein N-acetyltransferase